MIGLAVDRAVRGEHQDQVLVRDQVLEPFVGGDRGLGGLYRGDLPRGQAHFRRRLPARVLDRLHDRRVPGWRLPDLRLEFRQGLPRATDPRRPPRVMTEMR